MKFHHVLFVETFRVLVDFIHDAGLDALFHIILPNHETLNMLESPGLVTASIIETWIKDLTEDGVLVTPLDTNDPAKRHPVCQHDLTNMALASDALLNSCTITLKG